MYLPHFPRFPLRNCPSPWIHNRIPLTSAGAQAEIAQAGSEAERLKAEAVQHAAEAKAAQEEKSEATEVRSKAPPGWPGGLGVGRVGEVGGGWEFTQVGTVRGW